MKNSIDVEMDNLSHLRDFLTYYRLKNNGYGVYRFDAQIFGQVGLRKLQFISDVLIAMQNSRDAGTIAFYDAEKNCPGEFYAILQQYAFELDGGQLVITGNHPQHGKYEFYVKPK